VSLGKIVRQLLGKKWFFLVAHYYRSFFINLSVASSVISDLLPENASILDVGGGDGALINELLNLRPDLSVAALDISKKIGGALSDENRGRVRLFPGVSTFDTHTILSEHFDAVLISDVIHHIPMVERVEFIKQLKLLFCNRKIPIIIKDIEPSFVKSKLSGYSGTY